MNIIESFENFGKDRLYKNGLNMIIVESMRDTFTDQNYIDACQCMLDLGTTEINEANIAQWLKDTGNAIVSGAIKVKDQAIKSIAKAMQSVRSFAQMVATGFMEFIRNAYKEIEARVFKNYATVKEKVVKDAKTIIKSRQTKHTLEDEIKALKEMGETAINYFTVKMQNKIESSVAQMVAKDEIDEESLNDGLNESYGIFESSDKAQLGWFSKIAHNLSQYPPLSWIHNLEHTVESKTNNFLTWLSKVMSNKLNWLNSTEFVYAGIIAGLVAGYKVKDVIKDFASFVKTAGKKVVNKMIAFAIPGTYNFLKLLIKIAKVVWLVSVMEAIVTAVKGVNGSNLHESFEFKTFNEFLNSNK